MKNGNKVSVYLAGSIESSADLGKSWRNELTPFLEELNMEVNDPCKLEHHKLSGRHLNRLPQGIKHWHELKNCKEPHLRCRFKTYMDAIIMYDLDLVENKSDIIVLLWDRWSAGSSGEVTLARKIGTPVYTVATVELPAWISGCSERIFSNFDELKIFLKRNYKVKLEEPK